MIERFFKENKTLITLLGILFVLVAILSFKWFASEMFLVEVLEISNPTPNQIFINMLK